MKRQMITLLATTGLILLSLAASVSADSWFRNFGRGERGSGVMAVEDRETGEFNRIRLTCSVDLQITVGSKTSLTISGDDNLLDNIITEVVGRSTLMIDARKSFRPKKRLLIEITVPDLGAIEIEGSGDVEIVGLRADDFLVEIDGSGDVYVRGEAAELEILIGGSGDVTFDDLVSEKIFCEIQGSGDIELEGIANRIDIEVHGSGEVDARRLKAEEATVRIQGSGDVRVYAGIEFDGEIDGSGDIDVYGNPKHFSRQVDGSGDINRH